MQSTYQPEFKSLVLKLRTVSIIGLAAILVAILGHLIADQNFSALALISLIVMFIFAAVSWRAGIYLVLVITLVEGFARNYFDTPTILLIKDIMLIVIYVRVFGGRLLTHQPLFFKVNFHKPLVVLIAITLVQVFNPNIISLEVGLVGIRSGLLYMPLVFLIPELINSRRAIQIFSWFLLLITIPIAIYGIIQFYQGPKAYFALGAGFQHAVFITGGELSDITIYRPNSTFSWPSQYASFLSVSFLFSIGQLFQPWSKLKILAWCGLPLIVYAILVEGQRTDFVILPIAVLGMFVVMKRITISLKLLVPIVLGIVLILNTAAGAVFLDRFATISQNKNDVIFARLAAGWGNTVYGLTRSPFGVGSGMATLGAQYVNKAIPYSIEGYYGKIAAELSWLGLLVYIWLLATVAIFLFRIFRQRFEVNERWLTVPLIAFVWMVFYKNFTSNYMDLAVVNIFFWFSVGFVYATQKILETEDAVIAVSASNVNESAKLKRELVNSR